MKFEDIFKNIEKLGFTKKVKKKKINYFWEFKNSQLFAGLDGDKQGISTLMKLEKKIESQSKKFLGKNFSHPLKDYAISCYYINFQYFVEFLNRYHKELGIDESELDYINSGWDDLYVSIRLSIMGHYRSSFFHLRSFIENFFELVWSYNLRNDLLDEEVMKKLNILNGKGKITQSITPRMKYFSYSGGTKNNPEFEKVGDEYFNGGELAKVYNYLSKYTHLNKTISGDLSNTFEYDEKMLDTYYKVGSLGFVFVSRMLYSFFGEEMQKYWHNPILKPIPWENNSYGYIIREFMCGHNGLFYDLYEDKQGRELFLNPKTFGLGIHKLFSDADYRMRQVDFYDEMKKEV